MINASLIERVFEELSTAIQLSSQITREKRDFYDDDDISGSMLNQI